MAPEAMPVPPGGAADAASTKHLPQHLASELTEDTRKALDAFRQRMSATLSKEQDLRASFEIMHGGYPDVALLRFLKAREFDVTRAEKMLTDSLRWRVENDIDNILARPILGAQYEKVRASQQYGMTGFDKEGRPVLCVRVGLSYMDPDVKIEEYVHSHIQHNEYRDRVLLPEASRLRGSPVTTSVKIYDMSGLKLTHLGRMQMHRAVATIDDLNYPEKSEVYYVVNAPSVFGACWKGVKPLLQDRTRKKIQVLTGNGAEELLQTMSEAVLPHFVRYAAAEGMGSYKNLAALATPPAIENPALDCCSTAHTYHKAMQEYMMALRQKAKETGVPHSTSMREVPVQAPSSKGGEESEFGVVLEEALSKVAISEQQNGV